jgi:hypothetical protein
LKSLENLWRVAANELAAWCCTSAARDSKTVSSRTKHEGLSFLTITLPEFGKSFERSLESGLVDDDSFAGFRRASGPLPVFLGGFLRQVFDPVTGRLLHEPNVDCIFSIRQLTLMFQKILVDCSEERLRGAARGYMECEKEVANAVRYGSAELYSEFSRVAALLFEDVFTELENELYEGPVTPRHGPGATADRLRGNAKFDQLEWTTRLESLFPFWEHAAPNWRFASERAGVPFDTFVSHGTSELCRVDDVRFLEPGDERPVRVIFVPKTLKTPRVIAVEPTCMQYMQQAISNSLVRLIEDVRIGRNTRSNVLVGQIGFTDQMPNRRLARDGSLFGNLATLDLSEASDRVSVRHVESLVSRWPLLQEALMVTRSSKAEVPGNGVVTLSKYASMGSALCFPVEAMVFLTAVYLGIERVLSRRLTRKDVWSFQGSVRVYGDDIIVPTDYVRSVIEVLESLGFKVNSHKSYWNGKFRESC